MLSIILKPLLKIIRRKYLYEIKDHSFRTYANFFEKLTFLTLTPDTHTYVINLPVRIRWKLTIETLEQGVKYRQS